MLNLKYIKSTLVTVAVLTVLGNTQARENIGMGKAANANTERKTNALSKMGAGCTAATAQKELDINNVRTTILTGGDMWWNLSNARYEIPKVQTGQVAKHSLFSGALWIGGITQGNLRLAAQTYRQSGNDFFPGPLQIDGSASISADRCKQFDKIYKVTRSEIINHIALGTDIDPASANVNITEWPGNGGSGEAKFLAPFFDADGNGVYQPLQGEYPTFNQDEASTAAIPDQMMFVVYNDKGNIHTETQGLPLNLEFRLQAFGFATNDEVNNMTFYRTTIINRGTETIDSCIFGQWVDPDLGNYSDDFVECDVNRNLGICYNGDDNDEGILGYGLNPPSVGVNFFQGPLNENGKEIGLTKFVYYDNNSSVQGNPFNPAHFWNYLNGRWKDGQNITYGGNGRGGSDTASYMFPGSTDPAKRAAWTERIAGNTPADRRFLQTAGPFKLLPGAVNKVTIGVVWAKATTGGATGSFNLLKEASDKALILFKNNFKILRGPEFEDNAVQITELNSELIINLVNTEKPETFKAKVAGLCTDSTEYKFQGYQIYQLKVPSTPSDFSDREQIRLVAQCDILDGNGFIVNTVNDADLGSVKKIMVNGEDKGLRHSFQITKDAFSVESDQTLVNYKNYHYLIVPYAAVTNCVKENIQYLSGSKPIIITATPHLPYGHSQGTQINSGFTTGPQITRIEGIGNGGNFLNLTKETIEEALAAPYYASKPKYLEGAGPVSIKVINPFKVPLANFRLYITDSSKANARITDSLNRDSTYWILKNTSTNQTYVGTRNLKSGNEQIFAEIGLSISINQAFAPGDPDNTEDVSNGYIDASITFSNPSERWLDGVADGEIALPAFNWIRSGNTGTPEFSNTTDHDFYRAVGTSKLAVDPRKQYGNILGATWAPFGLAAKATNPKSYGPGISLTPNTNQVSDDNRLVDLQSVDVVFTSDKSKWTRCIVLEMGENKDLNIGNVSKGNIRASASVDKNGKPETGSYGMSWFPGYAINVETGERLNIIFGEDSSLPGENGADMVWNPTKNLFDRNSNGNIPAFGGKHHIYIMAAKELRGGTSGQTLLYKGPRYDECANYRQLLAVANPSDEPATLQKRYFLSQFMWVTIPMLRSTGFLYSMADGIIPNETVVKLRVKRPYAKYTANVDTPLQHGGQPLYEFSTQSIAPLTFNADAGKKAMDMINVSPNPYYAYSGYEDPGNALDNKVKIINVPTKCVVSIYTQNGFLVRRIRKDDNAKTYIEWDLRNDANVPISSGVYLIHIQADGLGERIVKWFGVMRPADFDSF